jgi:hypothetical protein
MRYIPKELEAQVSTAVQKYQALRKHLRELSEITLELVFARYRRENKKKEAGKFS